MIHPCYETGNGLGFLGSKLVEIIDADEFDYLVAVLDSDQLFEVPKEMVSLV